MLKTVSSTTPTFYHEQCLKVLHLNFYHQDNFIRLNIFSGHQIHLKRVTGQIGFKKISPLPDEVLKLSDIAWVSIVSSVSS